MIAVPLAACAVIALAAGNFLWQLGSSSYYVDEVQSVTAALHSYSGVLHAVEHIELTPPAYFYLLHEWLLRAGSHSEWVARLPSAVCGALLVGAICWLAWLLSERRVVALGAAALAAISPFLLEYAQRAQGYVFVALAMTLAVACALQAARVERRRSRWLAAAAAAAALSLWLHYTAALVVLALCAWVWGSRSFTARQRNGFIGACVLAGLALTPILSVQRNSIPVRTGVAATAGFTGPNLAKLLELPFDGRADALRWLGVAVALAALLALLMHGRAVVRERRLLLAIAIGVPTTLILLSALGAHLMLTRYAAVAAPFTIVAIAAAVAAAPRPIAALLASCAVAVSIVGLIDSHRAQGFYLDARGAVDYVRAHERPGDLVLAPSNPGAAIPLLYYGLAALHWHVLGDPATNALVARRHDRLWVIFELTAHAPSASAVLAFERSFVAPLGYRAVSARVFPSTAPLAVALDVPIPLAPPHR